MKPDSLCCAQVAGSFTHSSISLHCIGPIARSPGQVTVLKREVQGLNRRVTDHMALLTELDSNHVKALERAGGTYHTICVSHG